MSFTRWRLAIGAAAVVLFSLVAGERLVAATRIGVAAAVRNDVQGIQGGRVEQLAPGSHLFEQEVVKTGEASVAQLIFLDETSLSVGPKAQVTLDRFVFDPRKGAGDVVLSASRGAFRFISGSQDPRNYRINTPVATIGVRGTIVDCFIVTSGILCIVWEGLAVVEAKGIATTVRAGKAITVTSNGQVEGPFTPDASFMDNAGIFAFPLYSITLDGAIEYLDIGGDTIEFMDELAAQAAGDKPPPGDDDGEPPGDDDGEPPGDDDTGPPPGDDSGPPPSDDDPEPPEPPGDDDPLPPPQDDDNCGNCD